MPPPPRSAVYAHPANIAETQTGAIEAAFQEYTEDRKDIAILLINQHVSVRAPSGADPQIADRIRPTVDRYQAAFPALLEIPSKEHPYGELSLRGPNSPQTRRRTLS